MPLKLKIKRIAFTKKARKFYIIGLILIAIGGFFLSSIFVKAANESEGAGCTGDRSTSESSGKERICEAEHIKVQTDVLVNGQTTNFFRIGPGGSISFKVQMKLKSPPDWRVEKAGIVDGGYGDYLYFSGASTKNVHTAGFGLTIATPETSKYCGIPHTDYYKCQSEGDVSKGSTLAGSVGPYDFYKTYSDTTTFKAEDIIFEKDITISANDLKNFGVTTVKSGTSQGLNVITVYPNLVISFLMSGDDWATLIGAKQDLYIQLYPSDVEANTDNTPPPYCNGQEPQGNSCVPGYSSAVGGGESANEGSTILGFIVKFIGALLGLIMEALYQIFYWLVAPMIEALLSIHVYTDGFVAVIYPGWVVIRNVCNILFILALIAIGLGTLFRIESYQYKHLLVQLIIAALLINFSLVIAQAVLAVADTVQGQFLPSNRVVIASLAKDIMLSYRESVWNVDFASSGYFAKLVQPFFFLALATGTFMVFVALAAYLVIRIVMLWILLLISPVAYVAGILPATTKYRSEWWSNFLKYAFFTPIMAFFLNMTAVINEAQQKNPILTTILNNPNALGSQSSLASFVVSVTSNILILVFLIVSIKVAETAGIYGASTISKYAKGGVYAPFAAAGWGAKRGLGYAGRKWNEFTVNKIRGHDLKPSGIKKALFAVANPKATVKGWEKRGEELRHMASAKAEAAGLEVVEQTMTRGIKVIPRVLALEKQHEDEFAKQYMNMSREMVLKTARDLAQLGTSDEDMAAKRGILKVAMAKGYVDDCVQDGTDLETEQGKKLAAKMINNPEHKIQDWKKFDPNADPETQDWSMEYEKDKDGKIVLDGNGNKKTQMMKDENGKDVPKLRLKYNTKTRRALYETLFDGGHGHMDVAAMRLITEEGEEEGKRTGHFEYLKDVGFDFKTGKWDWRKGTFGEDFARGEMAKMQSRPQAAAAHHSWMDLSNDGKIDNQVFGVFAVAAVENPPFMQERVAHQALSGTGEVKVSTRSDVERDNYVIDIDEASQRRIANMAAVSPDAVAAMYLRSTRQGSTGLDVKNFMADHPNFQIRVGEKLYTVDLTKKANSDAPVGNKINTIMTETTTVKGKWAPKSRGGNSQDAILDANGRPIN